MSLPVCLSDGLFRFFNCSPSKSLLPLAVFKLNKETILPFAGLHAYSARQNCAVLQRQSHTLQTVRRICRFAVQPTMMRGRLALSETTGDASGEFCQYFFLRQGIWTLWLFRGDPVKNSGVGFMGDSILTDNHFRSNFSSSKPVDPGDFHPDGINVVLR